MSELRPYEQQAIAGYLTRLESALGTLTPGERGDIILVTQTRVREEMQLHPSRPVQEILSGLGEPADYARRFLGEPEPEPVKGRFSRLRAAGMRGFLAAPILFVGYAVVLVMLAIAAAKIFAPESTGVWVYYVNGVRHYAGGINTDRQPGTEVLGYWLVVASLGIATVMHLCLSALYRMVTRKRGRQ